MGSITGIFLKWFVERFATTEDYKIVVKEGFASTLCDKLTEKQ